MNQPMLKKDLPKRPGPSNRTMLWRGMTMGCAACGQRGGLFRRWTKMAERCPNCGLVFGRFEGQWIGAIGINTIVSFGILMITIVVSFAVTYPGNTAFLIGLAVTVAVVMPVLLFPFSRTFWTAIDLCMTPLEPHEVDWTKVDPVLAAERGPGPADPDPGAPNHSDPDHSDPDHSDPDPGARA